MSQVCATEREAAADVSGVSYTEREGSSHMSERDSPDHTRSQEVSRSHRGPMGQRQGTGHDREPV
ncbi:hypothetical protein E2C01_050760 [Portunus trituberculatus]|uniref:Uncharacterized protein n=1 Tax=Portunus trituberculatus TaxID=210409 RepID=A0A5B7GHC0_PORTR|nr:hypothetical protein [Portunus trituberculatus]